MATVNLGKIKLKWRGTYAGGTAYTPDDVVYYVDGSVGSSYICVAATTGNAPSSGGTAHASWNYLAKGQATSPTTNQGDVIVRGASADQRLAIGSAGQVLKVNSSANGLEYGTGAKILQIVQEYNSSFPRLQTTSTTFTSSDFKVDITPIAANSKILVDFRFISNNNGLAHDCYMTIRRSIAGGSFTDDWIVNGSQSNTNNNRYLTRNYGSHSRNEISTSMQYLDSPSYTLGQSIQYKLYARSGNSSNAIEIPSSPSRTPVLCFATEVAA